MITLKQAIGVARQAHKNQWRKPTAIHPSEELSAHFESAIDTTILYNGDLITKGQAGWLQQKPYITHPLVVMGMMETEEEKITAVLHDVIEDTDWNLYSGARDIGYTKSEAYYKISLTEAIYPHEKNYGYELTKNVYEALVLLTKIKNQKYKKYIKQVAKNKLATKVKLADIAHNLSDNPSEHAKKKYLKALPILLKSL